MKRAALDELAKYRTGPLFTPPSARGTVVMPGAIGGAGWGGAAVDPETGWLYVKATASPALFSVHKVESPSDTVDGSYMVDLAHSSLGVSMANGPEGTSRGGGRLPINKPPYGTLTAVDLNTGDTKWQVTLGDTPEYRANAALKGVTLPDKLGVAGFTWPPLVTQGGPGVRHRRRARAVRHRLPQRQDAVGIRSRATGVCESDDVSFGGPSVRRRRDRGWNHFAARGICAEVAPVL